MKPKSIFKSMLPVVFSCALLFGVLLFGVTGYCIGDKDADSNGTYDTAVTLPMKKTVQDTLSADDETDIYMITVEKNGYVMFVVTSAFRTAYFTLENEQKKYITSQYVYGSSSEPGKYKCISQLVPGTYYIVMTKSGSESGSYSVYATDQQPTSIKISESALMMEDSTTAKAELKLEVLPKDSVEPEIEWKSGDVFVARVDKGVVTANGLGCTTITASSKQFPSLKATCTVTVKPRQVASVTQNTNNTKKNKIPVTCSMGYSSANMPDGYHFYIFDKKTGAYVCKGKSAKNEFTFKGLKEETGYKVKVCAYLNTPAGEIEGPMSNEQTFYTAPKQLKATKITGIVKKNLTTYRGFPARIFTLKWKKVKGASAYKVYGQDKTGSKFTLMTTTKKPSADLYAGIGFTYKVYVVPVRTKHGVSRDGKKSPKYTINMKE